MNQHVDLSRVEDSVYDSCDPEPNDPIVLANDNFAAFDDVDLPIGFRGVKWPIRVYRFPIHDVRRDDDGL